MRYTRKSARRYSSHTLKMLWGRAAGRCSMPECRIELLLDDSSHDPTVIIGDIAHVAASSDTGPRGATAKIADARDEYSNLILLCKNCHARIDGQSRKFTVGAINTIKTEHEAWVRTSLPERGKSRHPWTTVLLQGSYPIDPVRVISALRPDQADKAPHILTVRPDRQSWLQVRDQLASSVLNILDDADSFDRRFAVFPLAPVSACIALGFNLTDRPRVKLFQYHRHIQSWDWSATSPRPITPLTIKWPRTTSRKRGQVIICFEVSSVISKDHVQGVGRNLLGVVRMRVSKPSTGWLRKFEQIESFGRQVHELFEGILRRFPSANCWHLLVAAPAPVAVRIGQAMNPSIIPPVQLYEFHRAAVTAYAPSILLGEH